MSSIAGPSHLPSSDSEDEHISLPPSPNYITEMTEWEEEQSLLIGLYTSNNAFITQSLEEDDEPKCRGSVPGHIVLNRGREEVKDHDNYFMQKKDGLSRLGLSTLQKVTAVFRILAYGASTDSTDEYVRIGESTAILCMKKFCRTIVEVLGDEYLRTPNANDVARLLKKGEECGFPGMLGSLDCMHWAWKNCPTAWMGQYSGRHGSPTIILEAVASYDLWIWYTYFDLPDSNNDINVLQSSNLFANLTQGIAPPAHYTIQGTEYNVGYYLADETYRKDVEWAFGVLQSQFAIVKGPTSFWDKHVLHDIMSACIIMHNMIVEDECNDYENVVDSNPTPIPNVDMVDGETELFQQFLARHRQMKNKEAHYALRNSLIEHLWERHGDAPCEPDL
ncbi:hypothetical protein HHK36_018713 [Tetracentron sinense]|uniref:Nuclease HARBI1 n=1 Tax=Tetracentron sinense TaxID=13715 RepID=A0A834YZZ1_TETSI|nr:hypothetical protein HHK36_018713 [Tetracentron sinense]